LKVLKNVNLNYPEDPLRFFNFEDFEERAKDVLLFVGLQCYRQHNGGREWLEDYKDVNKKKILITFEEPALMSLVEHWTDFRIR